MILLLESLDFLVLLLNDPIEVLVFVVLQLVFQLLYLLLANLDFLVFPVVLLLEVVYYRLILPHRVFLPLQSLQRFQRIEQELLQFSEHFFRLALVLVVLVVFHQELVEFLRVFLHQIRLARPLGRVCLGQERLLHMTLIRFLLQQFLLDFREARLESRYIADQLAQGLRAVQHRSDCLNLFFALGFVEEVEAFFVDVETPLPFVLLSHGHVYVQNDVLDGLKIHLSLGLLDFIVTLHVLPEVLQHELVALDVVDQKVNSFLQLDFLMAFQMEELFLEVSHFGHQFLVLSRQLFVCLFEVFAGSFQGLDLSCEPLDLIGLFLYLFEDLVEGIHLLFFGTAADETVDQVLLLLQVLFLHGNVVLESLEFAEFLRGKSGEHFGVLAHQSPFVLLLNEFMLDQLGQALQFAEILLRLIRLDFLHLLFEHDAEVENVMIDPTF